MWQHTTATLDPVNLQEGVGEYGQDQAQINLAHCPKAVRSCTVLILWKVPIKQDSIHVLLRRGANWLFKPKLIRCLLQTESYTEINLAVILYIAELKKVLLSSWVTSIQFKTTGEDSVTVISNFLQMSSSS